MYPPYRDSTPFDECMAILKELTLKYQSAGKGKLLVDVKQVGDQFSVNIPNAKEGLFHFTRTHVEGYVLQHGLSISSSTLINTLNQKNVDRPIDFLDHSLVSLIDLTGYGRVVIEIQNSRRFIGALTISYLGHTSHAN